MLQNTKNQGFTLIELLVAITIMGGISLVSVRLLYDILSVRSKQYSIEKSADSIRPIIASISSLIQSAQAIEVSSSSIKITGITEDGTTPCWKFQFNATDKTIEQISDYSGCSTSWIKITQNNIIIDTNLSQFTPTALNPPIVNITIVGLYKDNLEKRPFSYSTSVANRISI